MKRNLFDRLVKFVLVSELIILALILSLLYRLEVTCPTRSFSFGGCKFALVAVEDPMGELLSVVEPADVDQQSSTAQPEEPSGDHDQLVQGEVDLTWLQEARADLPVIAHEDVVTAYPDRFRPDLRNINTTLEDRLEVLPYSGDRDEDRYLVVPKFGVIVPVGIVPQVDTTALLNGREINYQQYLEDGVLLHPGSPLPTAQQGNVIVAGHTSYRKDNPGRYKTVFQFLAMMASGDQIWLYERMSTGTYQQFIYEVDRSSKTTPYDASVLAQPTTGQMITLYGCYPYGSLAERWVVQGVRLSSGQKED